MPSANMQNSPIAMPSNVTDALSYLESVKTTLQPEPQVYRRFAKVMRDYNKNLLGIVDVMQHISHLFQGYPNLVQGFNSFLPEGYRIDYNAKGPNSFTVNTPSGVAIQGQDGIASRSSSALSENQPPNGSSASPPTFAGLSSALALAQHIRLRHAHEQEKYLQFLDSLKTDALIASSDAERTEIALLSPAHPQDDILPRLEKLFSNDPDLLKEVRTFILDHSGEDSSLGNIGALESRRCGMPAASPGAALPSIIPQKRKRHSDQKVTGLSKPEPSKVRKPLLAACSVSTSQSNVILPHSNSSAAQPRRTAHYTPLPVASTAKSGRDWTQFFERVKQALDHQETYNEFLKLINLFTQDIIDTTRLVHESTSFLGDGELMSQFKEILGWDEPVGDAAVTEHQWLRPRAALDRPSMNQLNIRYGSYRRLPADEIDVPCSGRDKLGRSVLNDEWVSQPTFASEDTFFQAHKKNVYEEALHRSEEERHEYDFYMGATSRMIQLLEPLKAEMEQLSEAERFTFKLKPNLRGTGKGVYVRVLKKIYGREAGLDVWQELHDDPVHAIPAVISRLTLKLEEWKRAYGVWDKIWREIDARNYRKSLDHQAITFRAVDKKAITTRAFVSQIEAARDEQIAQRATLIDPLFARTRARHQLEFVVEDVSVLQDALKLTMLSLDSMQGQINAADRKKVETFVRTFVPLFFAKDHASFDSAFAFRRDMVNHDEDVVPVPETPATSGSARGRGRRADGSGSSGDLRKRLLKIEQAKYSRRTRGRNDAPSTGSAVASSSLEETMEVEKGEPTADSEAGPSSTKSEGERHPGRRRFSFFTNTTFYVIFRLLELLYARLYLFKGIPTELASKHSTPREQKGIAFGPEPLVDTSRSNTDYLYSSLFTMCEGFISGDLEQGAFEDRLRSMFGVMDAYKLFTVDKVVSALIKQVQNALSDPKSQELFDLLKREREITSPTTQDQINARRNAERVLGPDENLFRIDWLPESKTITVQLLGKDDSRFDDSEVITGRWQAYVASFVSGAHTRGVTAFPAARRPFMLRTRLPSSFASIPSHLLTDGSLKIRVCVRTYRLFFVPHTEEFLWRSASKKERRSARERLEDSDAHRREWLDTFLREGRIPIPIRRPRSPATGTQEAAHSPNYKPLSQSEDLSVAAAATDKTVLLESSGGIVVLDASGKSAEVQRNTNDGAIASQSASNGKVFALLPASLHTQVDIAGTMLDKATIAGGSAGVGAPHRIGETTTISSSTSCAIADCNSADPNRIDIQADLQNAPSNGFTISPITSSSIPMQIVAAALNQRSMTRNADNTRQFSRRISIDTNSVFAPVAFANPLPLNVRSKPTTPKGCLPVQFRDACVTRPYSGMTVNQNTSSTTDTLLNAVRPIDVGVVPDSHLGGAVLAVTSSAGSSVQSYDFPSSTAGSQPTASTTATASVISDNHVIDSEKAARMTAKRERKKARRKEIKQRARMAKEEEIKAMASSFMKAAEVKASAGTLFEASTGLFLQTGVGSSPYAAVGNSLQATSGTDPDGDTVFKCPFLLDKCQKRLFHRGGLLSHLNSMHPGFVKDSIDQRTLKHIRKGSTSVDEFWTKLRPHLDIPPADDFWESLRPRLTIPCAITGRNVEEELEEGEIPDNL